MRRIVCRLRIPHYRSIRRLGGMQRSRVLIPFVTVLLAAGRVVAGGSAGEQPYCQCQVSNYAIEQPLCGLRGDPARGRALAADSHAGNCLACHQMPVEEEPFHGTVGPPLQAVGARYSAAQIRLRVVDEQQINPMTVMPAFYGDPRRFNRVAGRYWGKTFLSAQQVEDLVAYLVTLK
jgi:sulfur-oxidizing protein SoxX